MTISSVKTSSDLFLADLNRNQTQMLNLQSQITSGEKIQQASDDPGAIVDIFQLQSQIAQNTQATTNFNNVKAELDSADTSLQSAIQAVETAITLGDNGATSVTTAANRANLAQQVGGLQESLVSLSQTSANGKFIFGGEGTTPSYELDLTQPDGVKENQPASALGVLQDPNGIPISVAKTAQDIFDPRNADQTPATGNAFAAINALRTALANNDQPGIAQATDALRSADTYLNSQLAFYGNAQNRVTAANNLAQKFQLQQETSLSQIRDTDVTATALELTQTQTRQQASLSVLAKVGKLSLFDVLT